MAKKNTKTVLMVEQEDCFSPVTGEIHETRRKSVRFQKMEPDDEFFKVSRYLLTIFAYQGIPLYLVSISLILAQKMEFKTNLVTLYKDDKQEIADMLGCSLERVRSLLKDCKKYDIIRPRARGKYEVNSFLYSTGDFATTKDLQVQLDIEAGTLSTSGMMENLITGDVVRKCVTDRKPRLKNGHEQNQLPGQLSFDNDGDIID